MQKSKSNLKNTILISLAVHMMFLLISISKKLENKLEKTSMSVQVDLGDADVNTQRAKRTFEPQNTKKKPIKDVVIEENVNTAKKIKSERILNDKNSTSDIVMKNTDNDAEKVNKEGETKNKDEKEVIKKKKKISDLLKNTFSNFKKNKKEQKDEDKQLDKNSKTSDVVLNKGRVYGKKDGRGRTKGNGNSDKKGNYYLKDRHPIETPQPIYDCNEQGIVYVRIIVDGVGKVILAEPGIRGSTTSAPCLLKRAKEAASNTTWSTSKGNLEKQEGQIIYNFTITK